MPNGINFPRNKVCNISCNLKKIIRGAKIF
ncbi:hypothetical protein ABS235_18095 [Acinetobacter pittii]